MKSIINVITPFSICFFAALILYPTHQSLDSYKENEISEITQKTAEIKESQSRYYSPQLGKSFLGFKEALGFKESQNNYFKINDFGYMGKYQFGKSTLALIGIYNTQLFMQNPELQEKALIAYLQRNKWVLRKEIKNFVGKTINGVKVTESGILAAAHLAGPGNVKKFFRSSGENNFADAYGTSVSYYMKKFGGFNLSFLKANKRAKAKLG